MNLENLEPIKKREPDAAENKIKDFFSDIYHNQAGAEARYSAAIKRLSGFLSSDDRNKLSAEQIQEIKAGLKESSSIQEEEEFVNRCASCLKPLLEWKNNDPRSFESKLRENSVLASGFTPLNEVLTYGRSKNSIHIHVSPSETLSLSEKLGIIKDGFGKLRDILLADESISEVSAVSWIVAANPGILEKLGFTIDGEIPAEIKEKHFKKESRPIFHAHISREDFLARYK